MVFDDLDCDRYEFALLWHWTSLSVLIFLCPEFYQIRIYVLQMDFVTHFLIKSDVLDDVNIM